MYLLLEFFNKHSQNLARATTIVLVVLATVSIADTLLFGVDMATREQVVISDPVAPGASRGSRTGGNQVSIAEFNLFGSAAQRVANQTAIVDAPETKLNLTLEGVFTAENEAESTAIVAEARRPGELYRIGDTLPGRVTLSAVHDDHIIIQRGARYETLRFSEESLFESSTDADEADLPQGEPISEPEVTADEVDEDEEDDPRSRPRSARPNRSSGTGAGSQAPSPMRDLIDRYRDRMTSDPDSLLSDLGLESIDTGSANGYQLGNQLSAQQLQQAGLMPGDVVLSLNGQPVNAVMQNQALIDAALAAGRVRVEIQRQERRFFITVPIR